MCMQEGFLHECMCGCICIQAHPLRSCVLSEKKHSTGHPLHGEVGAVVPTKLPETTVQDTHCKTPKLVTLFHFCSLAAAILNGAQG